MKSSIAAAIVLLLALTALSIGLTFAEKTTPADENMTAAINNTAINESAINESLKNTTAANETLINVTLINCTLENATMQQNDTGTFSKVKGRQVFR